MKNAFMRLGRTCVSALTVVAIGGGLLGSALLAAAPNRINITLPHAVTIGSTTLPGGRYTVSSLDMAEGEYFVIRGDGTPIVTLQAMKIASDQPDKTRFVFSEDGTSWHFEKLLIQGDTTAYQFVNLK